MNSPSAFLNELSEEALWRLEEICNRFEQGWQAGQRPLPEDFLLGTKGSEQLAVLRELLRLDVRPRPQLIELRQKLEGHRQLRQLLVPLRRS